MENLDANMRESLYRENWRINLPSQRGGTGFHIDLRVNDDGAVIFRIAKLHD